MRLHWVIFNFYCFSFGPGILLYILKISQIQERDNEINMLISFIKKKDLMSVQSNESEVSEIMSKEKNSTWNASTIDANAHSTHPMLSRKEAFEEYDLHP